MAAALGSVVLLAGGCSSRMGTPKGLLRIDGRRWIEHQLDVTEQVTSGRTIVVLGFEHERYKAEVEGLAVRATVVTNFAPERGSFSSLQLGLAVVAANEPAFVLPIDVPAPTWPVWASLRAALHPQLDATVPEYEGQGGHPVLLSAQFVRGLSLLAADARLDFELRRAAVARVLVEDANVQRNLNSPEDWAEFAAHIRDEP